MDRAGCHMNTPHIFALIGNPNTGKTTLFNALTGLKQQVGNYPGVTVERKIGTVQLDDTTCELIDLPGTYSLAAQSPDEMTAVDVLLGQQAESKPVDGVVVILDATNLRRNLYLVSQLIEVGRPLLIVLNMVDLARQRGIHINVRELSRRLSVPIVETCARSGSGLAMVRSALRLLAKQGTPTPPTQLELPAAMQQPLHTLDVELQQHAPALGRVIARVEALRLLIDTDGFAAKRLLERIPHFAPRLHALRAQARTNGSLAAVEAGLRYGWIRGIMQDVVTAPAEKRRTVTDRIDAVLTHRVFGTLLFLVITAFVFQSIYTWSGPLMDLIDTAFSSLGGFVGAFLPEGALRSLVVDGVIGGVGGVLVFLPQIVLLFFFLAILEDCGYMARAAFLMDKLFSKIGLSGKSFIPLLSSFACAVPGIMATRTIENRRDRIVTILVAPLMSCSARLPIYTILIAAFIPAHRYAGGWMNLQGLTLFAMHLVGVLVAIPIVWLLKRTMFRSATPAFVMELPTYKMPSLKLVAYRAYDRGKAFVRRAGTIIFAMTIMVWALSYFPRPAQLTEAFAQRRASIAALPTEAQTDALSALEMEASGEYLRNSAFGHIGHWIEPVVKPLGWDWRIGMATLASFPAREVIIAVLGTTYNLGRDVDETSSSLAAAMRRTTWPDGRPVYTVAVALSIMVFFALCCQCMATVATIRRETNSWGLAWFTFGYMNVLAYVGAWGTYSFVTHLMGVA